MGQSHPSRQPETGLNVSELHFHQFCTTSNSYCRPRRRGWAEGDVEHGLMPALAAVPRSVGVDIP